MKSSRSDVRVVGLTVIAVIAACGALASCDDSLLFELFPPDDYFDPVLSMRIDPQVTAHRAPLEHKYKGMYSISLVLEKPASVGTAYEVEHLNANCAFEFEQSRVDVPCGAELLPFWGDESGISISTYQVPAVVPNNEEVEFIIEFEETEQILQLDLKHGPVILKIAKWSDL